LTCPPVAVHLGTLRPDLAISFTALLDLPLPLPLPLLLLLSGHPAHGQNSLSCAFTNLPAPRRNLLLCLPDPDGMLMNLTSDPLLLRCKNYLRLEVLVLDGNLCCHQAFYLLLEFRQVLTVLPKSQGIVVIVTSWTEVGNVHFFMLQYDFRTAKYAVRNADAFFGDGIVHVGRVAMAAVIVGRGVSAHCGLCWKGLG
ncbi:hypothetical protein BCR34DRAFT_633757, partial [Clohesyomyces aquaticus]